MTHYEELGVSPRASRDEIRHAYKQLVRLLHPDQFQDDDARRLADLQMKRLNGILKLLTDPEARAAYDYSLLDRLAPPKRPEPLRGWRDPRWRPLAAVAGTLLVLVCCAVWPVPPPPRPQSPSALPPVSAPPQPKPVQRIPSRGPHRTAEDSTTDPIFTDPDPSPHAEASPPTETPAPDLPRAREPSQPPTLPTIAGDWLFVATPEIRTTGYPPEYIELRVVENHGALRGRYRARYRVADRAISPNVAFQFEGRAPPGGGVLPWRGAGGSQGEVTLRLLDNGNLDVEWSANRLGEELGLISGKARLVRKLD